MKQPTLIRGRIERLLRDLRVHISMLPEREEVALLALEGPQALDNITEIANFIMAKLGHSCTPSEPRFDKTRRAMAKRRGRPPRGEKAIPGEAHEHS